METFSHYLLFLSLTVAVSVGLSETKNLTGKAGESITLNTGVTGLRGNYQVLWSYGVDKRVIINFDNGKLEWNESQRFQLDERTGSLTILSLHINDSGQYQGQIINGNGSQQTFNLTVVGECLEACGEANPKNVCVCMELHAEKLETDSIRTENLARDQRQTQTGHSGHHKGAVSAGEGPGAAHGHIARDKPCRWGLQSPCCLHPHSCIQEVSG
uniref:Immunoglobulin domain-containing protein n=1 Tax=Monopterus albus TaxID=43700 RepID=A0A3Q3KE35_MONAL